MKFYFITEQVAVLRGSELTVYALANGIMEWSKQLPNRYGAKSATLLIVLILFMCLLRLANLPPGLARFY